MIFELRFKLFYTYQVDYSKEKKAATLFFYRLSSRSMKVWLILFHFWAANFFECSWRFITCLTYLVFFVRLF